MERGAPETLVLFRLKPKKTQRRARGPGPIRKRDWAPIANKLLKGRNVILHTVDEIRVFKIVDEVDSAPDGHNDFVVGGIVGCVALSSSLGVVEWGRILYPNQKLACFACPGFDILHEAPGRFGIGHGAVAP